MHDITMARSIVQTVLEAAQARQATAVQEIELVIGELTMLSPDQVEFWVRELLNGTIGQGAEVKVAVRGPEVRCAKCGYEGAVAVSDDPIYHLMAFTPACPECGAADLEIIAGNECMIRNIRASR